MSNAKGWGVVVGVALLFGACNAGDDAGSGTSSTATGVGGSAVAAVADDPSQPVRAAGVPAGLEVAECHAPPGIYEGGNGTCHPGGELVTVARVIDGDTLELGDGRTVRLLGVDTPEADTCAGPGATAFTRSKVGGQVVRLHREPGVDRDQYGRTLGYIQYGEPYFSDDLGQDLALYGWAKPYPGNANPRYMEGIERAYGIAEYQPEGMFAECEQPKVYGDDDGNGVADWEEDDDANVNVPNVNLPDGALTGGYCARKWWC